MKKEITKIIALLAAAAMFSGCGYIEDIPPEEDEVGAAQTTDADDAEQSDEDGATDGTDEGGDTEDGGDEDGTDEGGDEEPDSEADPEPDESVPDDSEDSSSETDTAEGGLTFNGDNNYISEEFGFLLPLPDGVTYNEMDDVLKPEFEDDQIQFRLLMTTASTPEFNLAVNYYETLKTLDDFVKDRWEHASVNAGEDESGDYLEILDTSNAPIGDLPAQIVTEKLSGGNGDFYTVRGYIQIGEGRYIYIQGNCSSETAMDDVRHNVIEAMQFQ